MLADEILLWGLVRLRCRLDGTVEQVHLIDEEIPEDTRAIAHHINSRPSQLFERDQLDLVHASQGVRNWSRTDQRKHLRQGLAVSLDIVRAPKGEGNRLGHLALLLGKRLEETVHHDHGHVSGCLRWDGVRVQGVHVLARRQHIRIADGVTARAWLDELAVEGANQASDLVVAHDFSEASLQVLEEGLQVVIADAIEATLLKGLLVRRAAGEEIENILQQGVHLLHASLRVRGLLHQRPDGRAARQGDLLDKGHILEGSLVVALVDRLDVFASALRKETRQALDVHLRAVQLRNVNQRGNALLCSGRHADLVQAHGQRSGLDLHEQTVHLSNNSVALLNGHTGHILLLGGQLINVLVQVALASSGHDAVDNRGTSLLVLAESLIGLHQLTQLLESLVEAGILRGRGQVGDGGRIGSSLGNGGLRRVVRSVVVQVGQHGDQAVRIAAP
mmetsp:Transcript_118420/g.166465  ORF Transcript_118420/g.166465 Transcript_118420/m.166465 type:complete len:447 (-) Transcript_118420:2313-3653(-)